MKTALLTALFLLLPAQAQTGAISGEIRMMNAADPMIIGANVRIIRPDGTDWRQMVSDDEGRFFVDGVPEGRYTVSVSTNGTAVTDACDIKAGETCRLTFEF